MYIALADTKEIGFFPSSHMRSSVFSLLSVILDSTYIFLTLGAQGTGLAQVWWRCAARREGMPSCWISARGFLHTYIHIIPLALLATSSQALASHVHIAA